MFSPFSIAAERIYYSIVFPYSFGLYLVINSHTLFLSVRHICSMLHKNDKTKVLCLTTIFTYLHTCMSMIAMYKYVKYIM